MSQTKLWAATRQISFRETFIPAAWPEVVEDDLDPRQLFWVVAEEEEAIVYILVVAQHFHDCFHNHFDNIGLLDQLSSLNIQMEEKHKIRDVVLNI